MITTHSASSAIHDGEVRLAPWSIAADLWHERHLVARLARREIEARYRGSVLGLLWALIYPLLMLGVYSFVFGVVFQGRRLVPIEGGDVFAVALFVGLIVFWIFSECVNQAPNLVLGNRSYVKKVVFPLPILPLVTLCRALFNSLASFLVLMVLYISILGVPPWTTILLPVLILPVALLSLGLSWFLASLGVFLRDIKQVVAVITTMIMFMSAIFYPIERLPESLRGLFHFNPVATVIEMVRYALFMGQLPDFALWTAHLLFSLLVAWLGYVWFVKTRRGFADVI